MASSSGRFLAVATALTTYSPLESHAGTLSSRGPPGPLMYPPPATNFTPPGDVKVTGALGASVPRSSYPEIVVRPEVSTPKWLAMVLNPRIIGLMTWVTTNAMGLRAASRTLSHAVAMSWTPVWKALTSVPPTYVASATRIGRMKSHADLITSRMYLNAGWTMLLHSHRITGPRMFCR